MRGGGGGGKKRGNFQRCGLCRATEGHFHKSECPSGKCSRCGAPRRVLELCACDPAVAERRS
jgi:hypothetical protein